MKRETGRRSPGHWSPDVGRSRARVGLVVAAVLSALCFAVFGLFPQADIALSAMFFDTSATPPAFPYDLAPWMVEFTRLTHVAANLTLVLTIAWLLFELIRPSRRRLQVLIVTLSLLLGPGLIINEVLKPYWGRARPRDATLFAGTQEFTPIHVISQACQRNCSFPSGHGGAAFAPLVGLFVSRRRRWLWYGLGLGAAIGFTRLLSGSHFLSDILASGIVVLAVGSLVTLLVLHHDKRRQQRSGRRDKVALEV